MNLNFKHFFRVIQILFSEKNYDGQAYTSIPRDIHESLKYYNIYYLKASKKYFKMLLK